MDTQANDSRDYIWHFKLPERRQECGPDDAQTEMLRRQLQAILGCVVLTSNGADVRITGFRFLREPETEHELYPDRFGH